MSRYDVVTVKTHAGPRYAVVDAVTRRQQGDAHLNLVGARTHIAALEADDRVREAEGTIDELRSRIDHNAGPESNADALPPLTLRKVERTGLNGTPRKAA